MTIPDAAIEAARDALFNDFDPYTKWCGVCSSQMCDDCIAWRDEAARAAIEAAMPAIREALAQETPPADNGQANTCRHDSASGLDASFGPGKVWRCDHCGLCWIEGYSPHDDHAARIVRGGDA